MSHGTLQGDLHRAPSHLDSHILAIGFVAIPIQSQGSSCLFPSAIIVTMGSVSVSRKRLQREYHNAYCPVMDSDARDDT